MAELDPRTGLFQQVLISLTVLLAAGIFGLALTSRTFLVAATVALAVLALTISIVLRRLWRVPSSAHNGRDRMFTSILAGLVGVLALVSAVIAAIRHASVSGAVYFYAGMGTLLGIGVLTPELSKWLRRRWGPAKE